MLKRNLSSIFKFLFLFVHVQTLLWAAPFIPAETMHRAEKAYADKNYALHAKLLNPYAGTLDDRSKFKLAYALYKTKDYTKSHQHFTQLYNNSSYLIRESGFFKVKARMAVDSAAAVSMALRYIKKHSKTALSDSLLIPVANYLYHHKRYQEAADLYNKHRIWGVDKKKNAFTRIRRAFCLFNLGKKTTAFKKFENLLKRYPADKETLKLAKWLEKEAPERYKKQFFRIVKVYSRNKAYNALNHKLNTFIKNTKNAELKEKARLEIVKIYFFRGKNNTALYGFNNLLKSLKNKKFEAEILIYKARIYLRKGLKQKAINSYLEYARKFPEKSLAAEAVWKSGWVSEERRDLAQASRLYKMVRDRWPNTKYAKEALFREGFTKYRLGKIEQANKVFKIIIKKGWGDVHSNRASYWSALCYDHLKLADLAKKLRIKLAANLWDDYYTMKSYLLHKQEVDSLLNFRSKLDSIPVVYTQALQNQKILSRFEHVFEIKDILGSRYAYGALEDMRVRAKAKNDWITIAEVYKKLKAYGKAFKVYDQINNRFYARVPYVDKPEILRERFPFYYDEYITHYAQNLKIEPELVLALMKQESVFDHRAHSWANAYGLMQLIPATAREMARLRKVKFSQPSQLFEPELNINLGTYYLKVLSRRFKADKEEILAAYNAGPHRVTRWKKLPGSDEKDVFIENVEFEQTRNYVRKVMKNYWAYKLLQSQFQVDAEYLLSAHF